MRIVFKGQYSVIDAVESVSNVLKLFYERYGIAHLRNLNLQMSLLDQEAHDVELMDARSSEILSIFEVYKAPVEQQTTKQYGHLKLVVDNTKN